MDKLVLVDGHSILSRAFYGVPLLSNAQGLHTNGVYGFLNILLKTLEEEDPQYLAVAFDLPAATFRHLQYDGYKGTRKSMPEELKEQVPLLQEVLTAMGIQVVTLEGYEADDILGTLAQRASEKGLEVTVVSGDRDLLQLAGEKVKISIPRTRGGKTVTDHFFADDVLETYQVTPRQFIDVKGLMGDTSDNIPGIPGVGEKTATKIILAYGSIENAYEHLEEIKPNKARESLRDHYDQALMSKNLATIRRDAPVKEIIDQMKLGDIYTAKAYELFGRLEFKNLLKRFDQGEDRSAVSGAFSRLVDQEMMEERLKKAAAAAIRGLYLAEENKKVLGLAISFEGETCFIPAAGAISGSYLQEEAGKLIRSASGKTIVMDLKFLAKRLGLTKEDPAEDASVAAYLVNPLKGSYPYEDLFRDYLGETVPSEKDLREKASLEDLAEKAPDKLMTLACYQAAAAVLSWPLLEGELEKNGMTALYKRIERPLIFVLASMETYGIRAMKEELEEYGRKLGERIGELEGAIYRLAGETFNINSPKQLGHILFEVLGLPGGKKTKTGYSTAADVLEKLAGEHGIVSDILEYRTLTKLKTTYAEGLAACILEDGKIHSTFHQTITATGRLSSTEPNLQNIPVRMELGRLLRKIFVPEEGFVFLDADYSQIELRVLAHCSKDENLIAAYHRGGDIHRITASQVFHVAFEEVTPLQRRNAKAVNFGIVYGISAFGLSQDLDISRKEAEDYIQKYFAAYPGVESYIESLVREAKEKGYALTMFGRRRPMPELSSKNFQQRSFGERVAMNAPIQGAAADIIKIAMIRVYERLEREGLKSRLLLQVHDELLVETAKDEIETVSRILEEEMTGAAQLAVPLEIDMHQGDTWYEAK